MKKVKSFLFLIVASLIITSTLPATASANSSAGLVSSAKNYIGVKYVYGGTTPSGFDCSGFTQKVFRDVGISIPRTTGQQYGIGTAVSKSNLQVGDIVFFNTSGRGVSHNGIYIGGNNFIHSASSKGVSIASINDPYYWGSRYIGARRVKNFTAVEQAAIAKPAAPALPTRSDIAELLTEELNLNLDIPGTLFSDVSVNHPQISNINAVKAAGIFSGNNGNFKPNENLTRAEMAKVLVEAFNLQGSGDVSFKDVAESNWASGYVKTLYSLNITRGYGDGNFGVNDKVTVSQMKMFIERINDL